MRKFRLYINGTNFLLQLDKVGKYGFYTYRYLEANNEQVATQKALDLIREELRNSVMNDRTDPPVMYIEEIAEMENFSDQKVPGRGFSFYSEESR